MYSICTFFSHIFAGVNTGACKNLEEALTASYQAGITTIDFNANDLENFPEVVDLMKKVGMSAASIHGVFTLDYRSEEAYNDSIEVLKKMMDRAVQIGSPCFMSVPQPPVKVTPEEYPKFEKAVRDMVPLYCAYAKEIGIKPTMENFSLRHIPYSTFEQVDYLLGANEDLFFTYDSGNFVLVAENEVEAASRYASRTIHVHLKDLAKVEFANILRDGVYYDSLELGGGFMDNLQALKNLRDGGFTDGALTIEVNGPDTYTRMMRSAEWLKTALKELA